MARTTGPGGILDGNAWALVAVTLAAGGLMAALIAALPGLKLPLLASLIGAGIALVSIGGIKIYRSL